MPTGGGDRDRQAFRWFAQKAGYGHTLILCASGDAEGQARDVRRDGGHLAAATSTGGLTGKRWGRIGDSPIVGAGTYAMDKICAVSATGTGEFFIRQVAARRICGRVQWKGQGMVTAADDMIGEVGEIGGDGGLITMDGSGRIALTMNSDGMYRGSVADDQPARTAIYAGEPDVGR